MDGRTFVMLMIAFVIVSFFVFAIVNRICTCVEKCKCKDGYLEVDEGWKKGGER